MGDYYYLETLNGPRARRVVHKTGCMEMTRIINDRLFLGTFYTSNDALNVAIKRRPGAIKCLRCCPK